MAERLDDPLALRRLERLLGRPRADLTEGLDPGDVRSLIDVARRGARRGLSPELAPVFAGLALDRYRQSQDIEDAVAVASEALGVVGAGAPLIGQENRLASVSAPMEAKADSLSAHDRAIQWQSRGKQPSARDVSYSEPELDRLEKRYWDLVACARGLGWTFAGGNLRHFLLGSGLTRVFPADTMRAFGAVIDAEEFNRNRFDDDWTNEDAVVYEKIAGLADGESVTMALTPEMKAKKNGKFDQMLIRNQPIWARAIKISKNPMNALGLGSLKPRSEFELFFGSGNSELTSEGRFVATRNADIVTVRGQVTHSWNDTYDWHEGLSVFIPSVGRVKDDDAVALENAGRAKSFEMSASWSQSVEVTLQIVEGEPRNPQIEWGAIVDDKALEIPR